MLPAILVFGLGLSATVAPLTATVLDSVAERRVGIASGINNGVSRVAGLLAIAVLGAVISAHFGARLDSDLDRPVELGFQRKRRCGKISAAWTPRSPKPRNSRSGSPTRADCPRSTRGPVDAAAKDASTSAFHLGALLAGLLMILGGIASGVGIREPDARPDPDADGDEKLGLATDG